MRGGFLHTRVLIPPVEALSREFGARVRRECPVRTALGLGFADLFIELRGLRIACEAELSADRIANDLTKAVALRAHLLLILVPERRVAQAAQRRLMKSDRPVAPGGPAIWILTLGPAIKRLTELMPLMTSVNAATTFNPINLIP